MTSLSGIGGNFRRIVFFDPQRGAALGAKGSAPVHLVFCTERSMSHYVKTFLADDSGATAIEYALMSSLIAIALIASLTALGTRLSSEFVEVSSALK